MNLGAPELIILLLVIPFIALTIWAAVEAGRNGDTGWLIGILGGWFFGVGWIVAIVYLVVSSGRRTG
jgi:hypothetical protein